MLSKLFEQEIGYSFTRLSLVELENVLPKLLVGTMEIAEHVEMKIQANAVNIQIMSSVFDVICQQTVNLPHTHDQVGCTLTSAIACALAKSSGKSVTVQKETRNPHTKITQIDYLIEEE